MTLKRQQILCVASGLLLGAAGVIFQHGNAAVCTSLERSGYGENPVVYDLAVEGLEMGLVPIQVEVAPREYTSEQALELFESLKLRLSQEILGENVSLKEVRKNLLLPDEFPEAGVRVSWRSSDPEILDSYGEIQSENCLATGSPVTLFAELSDGVHRAEKTFSIMVYPPIDTEQQSVKELREQIARLERAQPDAERIFLPKEVGGKTLQFRKDVGKDYLLFPALGIAAAVLLSWRVRQQEEEQHKKREKQLLYDYADVVYQLMVFTGAGLTVSRAWKHTVMNYEKRRGDGRSTVRAAYEEMALTLGEMECGRPEGQAVSRFGERCQLNMYRRLSAILGQNRHTGMKNLQELLEQEMDEAWEQQKQTARRMGEEAGTKLLLPLFLMLLVVMVLVMVPAMMAIT